MTGRCVSRCHATGDALRVKIREDAVVRNKAIYVALGVLPDGTRDILGLWIETTEGAKFWLKVFNDLKTRGVADILIAFTDGLKGMAEALGAVFPGHHRADLHRASDPQQPGLCELEGAQGAWPRRSDRSTPPRVRKRPRPRWLPSNAARGARSSHVVAAWRRAWDKVITFFAFPPAVRRVIYTTNAIESMNGGCARSSRPAATSRATMRRPS
jgi:putative transposase